MKKLFLLTLFIASLCFGQNARRFSPDFFLITDRDPGVCNFGSFYLREDTGVFSKCGPLGVLIPIATSSGGTITGGTFAGNSTFTGVIIGNNGTTFEDAGLNLGAGTNFLGYKLKSSLGISWSGTASVNGTTDLSACRNSAGILQIANGSLCNNASGGLELGSVPVYAGDALVGNQLGTVVATANATAQGASIGSTLLYTTTATSGGLYLPICYTVETVADAVSSTLPACNFVYTDPDLNATATVTVVATSTGNVVGQLGPIGTRVVINAKASTAVNYSTTSYASNTPGVMKYAVHLALVRIGN